MLNAAIRESTARAQVRLSVVHSSARPAGAVRPANSCSNCCLRDVCLPRGLPDASLRDVDELTTAKRRVARGTALYRSGDRFEMLFAVRSGAFKSVGVSRSGEEKVTGFYLPGEILGLDAINNDRQNYNAIALEDSEVCAIPFGKLQELALRIPELQQQLFRMLSRDIARDQGLMLLLGSMTAEQRIAAFLLSLSRRYKRLGYAAERFNLRMTREDIGNYLGLTLETVSRLLSRFHRDGLVSTQQREIELQDVEGLMEIVGHW
ncbi:MAG: fumarate/nitrate reduction transcriptional regulator Fnr [Betaproteobacteria bacterium]|nr:fumarate/nitrate reduction transcriptional regulator Fnr [Betaproteobacteria bacterium]